MVLYYKSGDCKDTGENLENCIETNPYPGLNIKDTVMNDKFNALKENEQLESVIPFLVERKYKYYNKDDKDSLNESKYNFFDNQKPLIMRNYDTKFQPDDVVKNNIINNFSFNILNNVSSLYDNIITHITKKVESKSSSDLIDYLNKDIVNLEKELKNLNNKNLTEESNYSAKYYDTNSYNFKINLLLNSIFIVSIILIISILDNNGIIKYGFAINVILIIVLLIYFTLGLYDISDRQYSNWDKKYFNYVNKVSDKV
jgi:hypothetical protein